jgi:CRP-like cAMP-binding protein
VTAFDELRRIPLFESLSDATLRQVAGQGLEKFVPAGEINGREGEPVDHLYVILEGELRITKEVTGGEVVINTYTPGAFGSMSRKASVVAVSRTIVAGISPATMRQNRQSVPIGAV